MRKSSLNIVVLARGEKGAKTAALRTLGTFLRFLSHFPSGAECGLETESMPPMTAVFSHFEIVNFYYKGIYDV